jgi:hypothetical protein
MQNHQPTNAALTPIEAEAAAHALNNRVQCLQELLDWQIMHCRIGDSSWSKTYDQLDASRGAMIKLQNLARSFRED